MNRSRRFFRILIFVVLPILFVAAVLVYKLVTGLTLEQLKSAIEGMGGMASAVFMILCVVRGLIFIPCGLLSALGGMLFGPLLGTVFTLLGLTAGSVITFLMARFIGKGWAQRVLKHRYDRYEAYISRDSFYSVFLMRVVPILPYDAVSCIAGMSRARLDKYILATLIGSVPGVFIYVFFGDSVRSMSAKRIAFAAAFMVIFAVLPFYFRKLVKLISKDA